MHMFLEKKTSIPATCFLIFVFSFILLFFWESTCSSFCWVCCKFVGLRGLREKRSRPKNRKNQLAWTFFLGFWVWCVVDCFFVTDWCLFFYSCRFFFPQCLTNYVWPTLSEQTETHGILYQKPHVKGMDFVKLGSAPSFALSLKGWLWWFLPLSSRSLLLKHKHQLKNTKKKTRSVERLSPKKKKQ